MIPHKARTPLVALLLLVLCLFFFWQTLTPDPDDRMIFAPGDFTRQFCAFASYESDRIQDGSLPLWDPYSNAGTPFHADPQVASFYPFRWALAGLLGGDGLTCRELQLEVIFHVWLISLMTYIFLKQLVTHEGAAFAGALMFTYAGYQMSYPILSFSVLEAGAWLPLMLLGINLSIKQGRQAAIMLASAGLGLSLLAGHPQTTLYITALAAAYLLFLGISNRQKPLAIFANLGIFVIGGAALGAVQLLPTIQLMTRVTRFAAFDYDIKGAGYLFGDLMGMIWPDLGQWSPLYIGIPALILASGAAARMGKQERFFLVAFLVALGFAFGNNFALYDAFYAFVPVIGPLFRSQERVTIVIIMCTAILATYQLDWLLIGPREEDEGQHLRDFKRGVMGFTVVLSLVWVAHILMGHEKPILGNAAFVMVISLLFLLWLRWRDAATPGADHASALLAVILVLDLFTVGMNATNSFDPDEPASYDPAPLAWSTLYAPGEILYHVDGSWGIQGRGLFTRVPDIYTTSPIELADIAALRTLPVDRMWEILAVRYVTMDAEITLPDSLDTEIIAEGLNYSGKEIIVYEVMDPRPFAHLVYDAMVVTDPVFALQIIADPTVDLRSFAVTDEPLPFDLSGQRPADAEIIRLTNPRPERYDLRVTTSEDTLLTMAIPAYPGWQAWVNGERVPTVTTYTGLVGVPLSAGESLGVTVIYRPPLLIASGAISALALIGMLIAAAFQWRRKEPVTA